MNAMPSGTFPLTQAQKRIWFMQKMHPDSGFMNFGLTVQFLTHVSPELLKKAIVQFMLENDSIRLSITTSASDDPGMPRQYISPEEPPDISLLDFCNEQAPDQAARLWIDAATRQPYPLEASRLYDFALLRLSDTELWLYLKCHHILGDGTALVQAGADIADLYLCLARGQARDFQKKPSYLEAIDREHAYLESDRYAQDRQYWDEKFRTLPEPLSLARTGNPTGSLESGRYGFAIDGSRRERVDAFCREAGVNPSVFFLALFYAYLYRMTGQRDIVLASITGNRTSPRDKHTFGMFAGVAAFRYEVDPQHAFTSHCQAFAKAYTRMLRHQKYPYNQLVARTRERHPITGPLYHIGTEFQVMNFRKDDEIGVASEIHFSGSIADELHFHVKDHTNSGLYRLDFEYQRALFGEDEIAAHGERYMNLLDDALSHPERTVADLCLLSEAEARRILTDFNRTERDFGTQRTFAELFAGQVRRTPDAVAVEFGDERLTYRELEQWTRRLAHGLRSRGVAAESVVAVMLPKGPELIAAMIAVLRAGGAYLPIDPDYPAERIAYMLNDSQAPFLMTKGGIGQTVAGWRGEVILVEPKEAQGGAVEELRDVHWPFPGEGDLAYIIYTSGSTGQPKGVMIEHRGLGNLIHATKDRLGLSGRTRILQFSSCSFDASVVEIFPVLCSGGTLVADTREAMLPGKPLVELIGKKAVNVFILPASVLAMLSEVPGSAGALRTLETVISGGEPCPAELAAAWSVNRRFINAYGPTEATVWATDRTFDGGRLPPDIGRPIANTQVYVLDENRKPVPVGVAGEMYIGGAGLARGYWNRPGLTAERFVEAELDLPVPGAVRLYRTGDLARYLPDGSLEYIGRADHQVKIRGHRIELEEIETVLGLHPEVRQAVVVVHDDGSGKRLVAFAIPVADGTDKPQTAELRAYLQERLPAFMVPHFVRVVDRLPLTPSGKADRAALSKLGFEEPAAQSSAAPLNQAEEVLARIWKETLGLSRVGVQDHFFDLGGDSFRLLRVHQRIREALDDSATVVDLFRFPTIRALAGHLNRSRGAVREEVPGSGSRSKSANRMTSQRKEEIERQKRLRTQRR
ncbi:amino acid adenylation domain-containing protein [Paenibacillus sp. MZ04-78.2]|uniref:non-ribosomal peptide synthetase n=1 Tax=Paenibacillus sp. MZ04-78.2 TaxID=2962034 RepID=UPI0020B7D239|nr:amino acid adenylation domain-containing protein [Paenibacillus sp. MZ04-78.2]MCP3776107.1 amino acid adenylation domain-containing protein [Paenibacillus sp. MZ04-78.2]